MPELAYSQLRLRVASASTPRVVEDTPGLHCVGFPEQDGCPALVVVWDEDENVGASATNCIETVLSHLRTRWAGVIAVESALVVERDSGGDFDHAVPDWSGTVPARNGAPQVNWRPLRWAGEEPRSLAAFKAMFGERATLALQLVNGDRA